MSDVDYDGAQAIDDLAEAREALDELRAIVAPLLNNPGVPTVGRRWVCVWCRHLFSAYPREQGHREIHAPECPVLRKDELLGRV